MGKEEEVSFIQEENKIVIKIKKIFRWFVLDCFNLLLNWSWILIQIMYNKYVLGEKKEETLL